VTKNIVDCLYKFGNTLKKLFGYLENGYLPEERCIEHIFLIFFKSSDFF